MKNGEVIANDLVTALKEEDDELLEYVSDYIVCPSDENCEYNGGKDRTQCTKCKMEWLKKDFD